MLGKIFVLIVLNNLCYNFIGEWLIMSKSLVLFSKDISSEGLVNLYKKLGVNLSGKVAVKLHSGEEGNQNYVKPMFVKDLIDYVGGTVVECNTAYAGERNSTSKHNKVMDNHGWSRYFDVDIMDSDGEILLPIKSGKVIKLNIVGKNIVKYNSMLVLSHFKGHPMGGYGGALKQLSIGCASSNGKAYIHSAGKVSNQDILWDNIASQDLFLESMADAALSVCDFFKGNIVYINMMVNLSVDCDCCRNAEDPCMEDIGILASLDPVALDQACIDLIYGSGDKGRDHFVERIERQNGVHTIEAACSLGIGSRDYELVCID